MSGLPVFRALSADSPARRAPLCDFEGRYCRDWCPDEEDEHFQWANLHASYPEDREYRQRPKPKRGRHCRSPPRGTDEQPQHNSDWENEKGHVASTRPVVADYEGRFVLVIVP